MMKTYTTILQSHHPTIPRIVFFGNTKYSVFGLEIIHKTIPVILVVTIADRPSGRKRELKPSPVKQFAKDTKIPILEADKLDESKVSRIAELKPDFLIVEDYGLILPESILEIPKYAPLNVHHSLLPKYRGPSPAPTTILNDEKISGVTIISMTGLVDAGDILAQEKYTLKENETTDSLLTQLNILGGHLVLKVIADFEKGQEKPIKQDDKLASYTHRLTKQDGYIDIQSPADPKLIDRMIRAYFPWPNVWTRFDGKIIKFLPEGKIQPEGKKPMIIKEFLNGYPSMKNQLEKLLQIN